MKLSKEVLINTNQYNCVVINYIPYFIYKKEKSFLLISGICPHRGGPIHLGKVIVKGKKHFIKCPWHDNKFKVDMLSYTNYSLSIIGKGKFLLMLEKDVNVTLIQKNCFFKV